MTEFIRLLIVDDESLARRRIRSFQLNDHGYEIVGEAENGQIAFELINRLKPHIVVADIGMPVMNGLDLLKRIHKLDNPPKMLVVTCYEEFEKVQTALKFGAKDYITKFLLKEEDFIGALDQIAHNIRKEERNNNKMLNQLLLDLMEAPQPKLDTFKELNEIGFNPKLFCIVTVKTTHGMVEWMEEMQSDIEGWADEHFNVIQLRKDSHTWVLIMTHDNPSTRSLFVWTSQKCKELLHKSKDSDKDDSESLYISISSVQHDIRNFSKGCSESIRMNQWAFYEPKGTIIKETASRNFNIYPVQELHAYIEKVRQAYVQENVTLLLSILMEWVDSIENIHHPNPYDVKQMVVPLLISIPNTLLPMTDWLQQKVDTIYHITDLRILLEIFCEKVEIGLNQTSKFMRPEIKEAIIFIHNHYELEIDAHQVSKEVSLSISRFNTLFRMETDSSFNEYLQNMRLEKAKELILNTNMKVYEVADAVGIPNHRYFSKLFKNNYAFKPLDYRKNVSDRRGDRL